LIHEAQPASKVLLLGILPRGGQDDATFYSWPSKFTPAMELINGDLASMAKEADWIDFMDCSHALLPGGTVRYHHNVILILPSFTPLRLFFVPEPRVLQ
jgi:hypothetical protein